MLYLRFVYYLILQRSKNRLYTIVTVVGIFKIYELDKFQGEKKEITKRFHNLEVRSIEHVCLGRPSFLITIVSRNGQNHEQHCLDRWPETTLHQCQRMDDAKMLQGKKDSCSYFAVLLAILADKEFYSIRFVRPSIRLFSFVDNITNSFATRFLPNFIYISYFTFVILTCLGQFY